MTTLKDVYITEQTQTTENKPNPCSNATAIIDLDGNVQFFWEHITLTPQIVSFRLDIENIRVLGSLTKDVIYLVSARTSDNLVPPFDITLWAISAEGVESDPYTANVTPVSVPDSIIGTGGGLRGITLISGNYTVKESDNRKVILGTATVPDEEYLVTFPATLSNGFECYVVNSLEGSTTGNRRSYFTIQGVTFLTRTHNNRIKAGESRLFTHISNGRYFTLGKNDFIYDSVSIFTNGNVFVNILWEIKSAGITMDLPQNPVDGAFIGFKVDNNIDVASNPVILNGNNKLIEGATTYQFSQPNERIIFFFTGTEWIYVSRTGNSGNSSSSNASINDIWMYSI